MNKNKIALTVFLFALCISSYGVGMIWESPTRDLYMAGERLFFVFIAPILAVVLTACEMNKKITKRVYRLLVDLAAVLITCLWLGMILPASGHGIGYVVMTYVLTFSVLLGIYFLICQIRIEILAYNKTNSANAEIGVADL